MKQRLKQQARHTPDYRLPALSGRQASGIGRRTLQLLLSLGLTLSGVAVHSGASAAASATTGSTASSVSQTSVLLEQLSSSELRERIAAGSTTVIIPVGGTEQSGPYLALGKHNVRAQYLAQQIALKLGHAIVAPVIAYVPEGEIKPPTGHMRFSGTISIPEATFESLLDATARSLRQHGFRDVVFIGDHGGYQKSLSKVAQQLNRSWAADDSCRALALLDYYQVTQTGYVADLKSRGFSEAEIGLHAGLADTALMLAVDKTLVRSDAMAHQPKPGPADGVQGDPRRASAELGQLGVQRIVDASVSRLHTYLNERAARATSTSSHRN